MIIITLLLLPLLAAAMAPLIVRMVQGNLSGWCLGLVPFLMLCLTLSQSSNIAHGQLPAISFSWFQSMHIAFAFRIDGLSQLMLLLISGIGFPIVIYSKPYFGNHDYLSGYYVVLFIFMAAMTGAVCANDLLTLFVFWEITSICSFVLIGLKHRYRTVRKAAIEALFITTIGGLCLLASFVLLIQVSGNHEIHQLVKYSSIVNKPLFPWIFVLFLIGVFTKSAQFPFGFWLPGAMRAPTPVSAYLHSATMVQLGIYLLARFHPLFAESQWWFGSLALIGSISMLTSALFAFKHYDMKLILAYTTITALGSLVVTLASNHELMIKAAVSFLLVHALYKANLFMAVGDIQHQTGTRHLKQVGGLHHAMPITMLAMCVAGSAMAGLPPLLGFYVKEMLYEASLNIPAAAYIQTFIILLANMMMAAIAFILVLNVFWGKKRPHQVREADMNMSVNAFILAVVTIILSLFTNTLDFYILSPAAEAILGRKVAMGLPFHVEIWRPSLILSIITLSGALLIYLVKYQIRFILIKTNVLRWIFPERILQVLLTGSVLTAKLWTTLFQHGYMNRYLMLAFLSTCVLMAYESGNFLFTGSFLPSSPLLWSLSAWLLFSAAPILLIRRFISGLIALGVFGLGLAFFFVTQGAPDLAMTQALVETLMVILIVFTLSGLINWPNIASEPNWHCFSRACVAVFFGLLIGIGVERVLSMPFDNAIGRYYLDNSVFESYAANVVNAILVNFRALDTLGETTVLLVGALGIFSLLGTGWRKRK